MKNSKKFNPWDVFLSDEEIMIIHNSGGLIGLNLDERIMMGKEVLDVTRKGARWKLTRQAKIIWIEPLIEQIIHIARTIYAQKGDVNVVWDNICIGSDFDGMITPIKAYRNANCFPEIDKMIFERLRKSISTEPFLANKSDSEIREVTDKIVWKNILRFLKKHYN